MKQLDKFTFWLCMTTSIGIAIALLVGCSVTPEVKWIPPMPIKLPVSDTGYAQIGNALRVAEPITLVVEADFQPGNGSVAGFQWSSNMVDWVDFGMVAYPVAGATLRGTNVQVTAAGFYRAVAKP